MPAVLLAALFLSIVSAAQTPPVNVTIDASKTGAPISKYIYGQFLEHGGDIVNTGVWAELLADRKFYYPVSATAPQPPQLMGNAAGNPRFRRPITRWWAPIGGDGVVTMDTKSSLHRRSDAAGEAGCKDAARHRRVGHCGAQRENIYRPHRAGRHALARW